MTASYVVYMVRCADGTYYTGSTNNLDARIKHHNAGHGAKYVRGRGPVTLVYVKGCRDARAARQAEWQLKQRSHQEKAALSQAIPPNVRLTIVVEYLDFLTPPDSRLPSTPTRCSKR